MLPQLCYCALASGGRVDAQSCRTLWDDVRAGTPAGTDVRVGGGGYAVRDSVMLSFTRHTPGSCLTADDVEALSTLYPDCAPATARSRPPACHGAASATSLIGAVRTLLFVLTPLFGALWAFLVLGEQITFHEISGAALLLAAIGISALPAPEATSSTPPVDSSR